jgi:hypothetical protein
MTDVIIKATKVKRRLKFALFLGKNLTKVPSDKSAVISDNLKQLPLRAGKSN